MCIVQRRHSLCEEGRFRVLPLKKRLKGRKVRGRMARKQHQPTKQNSSLLVTPKSRNLKRLNRLVEWPGHRLRIAPQRECRPTRFVSSSSHLLKQVEARNLRNLTIAQIPFFGDENIPLHASAGGGFNTATQCTHVTKSCLHPILWLLHGDKAAWRLRKCFRHAL